MDDRVLLERFSRDGDAEAFAEIARRHAGLVYGTCLRVLGDPVRAEDAAQEAFLALARHAGAIRQSLVAWLHRVALHAALRQRRRERTAQAVEIGDIPAPVREAWRALLPQLDDALESLPETLREVVARRYLQGQVQASIAAELGISQATVSRRLEDGVRRLRAVLATALDERALGSVLALAAVPPPAPLIAACGKIAIAGAPVLAAPAAAGAVAHQAYASDATLLGTCLSVALAIAVSIAAVVLRDVDAPSPAPAQAPPPTPAMRHFHGQVTVPITFGSSAPLSDVRDVRERPVTIHVEQMSCRDAVACLDLQLRQDLGERIVLVPGQGDEAPLTLDAEGAPLREVLSEIHRQSALRVRVHGGMVVVDHDVQQPDDGGWRMQPWWTPADIASHLDLLVSKGDLDLDGRLLGRFAEADAERCARDDPPRFLAMQEGLCEALARVGATWDAWRPGGGALRALADDATACAGLRGMWRLCAERHLHILPFQIHLAAALGCRDLLPQLRAIAEHPFPARPGLAAAGLVPDLACFVERMSALRALGALAPDAESAALIRNILRTMPTEPARPQLVASMGELGSPADADLVMPQADDDPVTVAACVLALARLDPGRLASVLARPGMARRARLASLVLPRAEFLSAALADADAPDFLSRLAAWHGTALLEDQAVRAGCAAIAASPAGTSAMRLAIRARAGDDGALDALVDAVARDSRALSLRVDADEGEVGDDDDVACELLATVGTARQQRALARLRAELDLAHAGDAALGMLRVRASAALVRELMDAWPRADAAARASIARALARCQIGAGADAIIQLLGGPDAHAVARALHASDLHACRLRILLAGLATYHLGGAGVEPQPGRPQDAALGRELACCGLLAYLDTAPIGERLRDHLAEVTPAEFRQLTARAGAPPLWRDPLPVDLTWTLACVAHASGQESLLRACDDVLVATTTRDSGQMCLLVPPIGHAERERGPASVVTIDLSGWERLHPLSDAERADRDLIDESAVLSGSLDAAERATTVIFLHPAWAQAAAPTRTPSPSPSQSQSQSQSPSPSAPSTPHATDF